MKRRFVTIACIGLFALPAAARAMPIASPPSAPQSVIEVRDAMSGHGSMRHGGMRMRGMGHGMKMRHSGMMRGHGRSMGMSHGRGMRGMQHNM